MQNEDGTIFRTTHLELLLLFPILIRGESIEVGELHVDRVEEIDVLL